LYATLLPFFKCSHDTVIGESFNRISQLVDRSAACENQAAQLFISLRNLQSCTSASNHFCLLSYACSNAKLEMIKKYLPL